jgi:hypothetical protein
VDVHLAVDALEHAVARNLSRAHFIFGDLDFEPLLVSLNHHGVFTLVWFDIDSVSADLLEAADEQRRITLDLFYNMADDSFRARHELPYFNVGVPDPGLAIVKNGIWEGRPIQAYASHWTSPPTQLIALQSGSQPLLGVYGKNLPIDTLERAFIYEHGGSSIQWRP